MKTDFEIGQLVRSVATEDIGRVINVDRDYYGARQAFKVYGAERGQALRPSSVNGIGPTKDGIRDRVRVQWYTNYQDWGENMTLVDGKYLILMEEESDV